MENARYSLSSQTVKHMVRLLRAAAPDEDTFIRCVVLPGRGGGSMHTVTGNTNATATNSLYSRSVVEIIMDIREPLESEFQYGDWNRCLDLSVELLANTRQRSKNPLIASLEHVIILPAIKEGDSSIRFVLLCCSSFAEGAHATST